MSIIILKGEITMGVFDSIACSVTGKYCSYEHNAEAAADGANKGAPKEEQVVPVTSIDTAKQMAMTSDLLKDKHFTVFGAAKLKDPKSISTRNEYCMNLADREGINGDAILALNVNDQSIVCAKYMNRVK